MKTCLRSIFAPTIILALIAGQPVLHAHAILVEAVPEQDATVNGPDVAIQLKFNSRVDGERSRIYLVLPDKSVRTLSLEKQESLEVLHTQASGLTSGSYRIRWQVLAADGHITRGEYVFTVK